MLLKAILEKYENTFSNGLLLMLHEFSIIILAYENSIVVNYYYNVIY